MTSARDLAVFLDDFLAVGTFDDYAPNGLQVEPPAVRGRALETVVFGVSANAALIAEAAALHADAIVVHHGFFWRGESPTLTGLRAARVGALFAAEIALLGYHLPLDAHAQVGNAAGVLRTLGIEDTAPFTSAGRIGRFAEPVPVADTLTQLSAVCGDPRAAFLEGPTAVRSVAVVTGGGPGFFEQAAAAGVDLFVTGEASEQSQGLARELGVNFAAFGHHATERFGPSALCDLVAGEFGVRCVFVDVDNPV